MLYRDTMPTSLLADRKIRPIQFRKWADAERQFARGRDRQKVDELKASIKKRGLLKPIKLGVSDRHPDVYIGDGHHRAIALRELGVSQFPFHWYWIRDYGVQMEDVRFPYHYLGL